MVTLVAGPEARGKSEGGRRGSHNFDATPQTVMLGLDPSIQSDRSAGCPWTLGSRPRVAIRAAATKDAPNSPPHLSPNPHGSQNVLRPEERTVGKEGDSKSI